MEFEVQMQGTFLYFFIESEWKLTLVFLHETSLQAGLITILQVLDIIVQSIA